MAPDAGDDTHSRIEVDAVEHQQHELQQTMTAGWRHVTAGLRQVGCGTALIVTALAAEVVRVALERGSDLVVLAGARLARKLCQRFRPPS